MGKIHDQKDERNIKIENIGICGYKLPIKFRSQKEYSTIGEVESGVSLNENTKAAHLSRIIEVIDTFSDSVITIDSFDCILRELSDKLESDNANLKLAFDLVVPSKTPISEKTTHLNSKIVLGGRILNDNIEKSISMTSHGAMLCPNSKSISKYGAHSQKCKLISTFHGDINKIVVEDALKILFGQFSAEVYGLIKSVDEKYLTEKAYDNPKFSEDLVRDTLLSLKEYYSGGMIETEIENMESIHQHNVYSRGRIR